MKLENMDDTGNVGTSTPHLTLLEVGMSSGDDMDKEEVASTYNRSYEESLKGKELSDSVPEVQDEDIGTSKLLSSYVEMNKVFPF